MQHLEDVLRPSMNKMVGTRTKGQMFEEGCLGRILVELITHEASLFCRDKFIEPTVFRGEWLASSCVDHL